MAKILTYGNTPPTRGRVQIGERVRTDTQALLVACLHEQWAASGEQLGGLLYDRAAWSTPSTGYNYGSGWALSRWQPLVHVRVVHAAGTSLLHWRAFVTNLDVRLELLSTSLAAITTQVAVCASGSPQWLGGVITVALGSSPLKVLRVSARRNGFDTTGRLHHLGAICRPSDSTQIP